MNTIEATEEVVQRVREALVAEAIDDFVATLDLLEIPPALAAGKPVVAIQPPKLEFLNYHTADAEFELIVIAGPYADRLAAWKVIDPIVHALQAPMNITKAEPANFQHPSLPDYPAYVLTFTDSI